MFLNYESQKSIALGDIFIWDGKRAEFEIVNRCSNLGLRPIVQTSNVKSSRLFNSNSGVKTGFVAKGPGSVPTMDFAYKGSGRYSMQAFDTIVESIDEVDLAHSIETLLKSGSIWSPDWIVVTSVWKADAFTQLVAGGRSATAGISANLGAVTGPFNIADTSIGVGLHYSSDLCSQQIAGSGALPFFIGMKYRSAQGKRPHMVRYGS